MPHSGCSALHGVNPNLKKKKTQAELCLKGTFVIGSFMFVTTFLDMKIPGEETLLSFPAPNILK